MFNDGNIPSSFRDPSGSLFYKEGCLYRRINEIYGEHYDTLINSGLFDDLVQSELLIPHEEVSDRVPEDEKAYKIIKPELIPFISYPYEWSFNQLKDAALVTLQIQKRALDFGLSLKDCSAYNIQFLRGKPVLIDTLSFEKYTEGQPWIAYRQFCQHFLAPLALMSYKDVRLVQLLRIYIDGIPLDLASTLLPARTLLSFSNLTHIHVHAKSQKHFADKKIDLKGRHVGKLSLLGLINNLENSVKNLKCPRCDTTGWLDYYDKINYSEAAFFHKKELVSKYLEKTNSKIVWDLGASTGVFSRIPAEKNMFAVSFDIEPHSVDKNYLDCKKSGHTNILPLWFDFTNPSPPLGWNNRERMSLFERGPADTALALALLHHLAISNNVPFNMLADFFGQICKFLIIEFVPKDDSQIQKMLSTRKDTFPDYNQETFEAQFKNYFEIIESEKIKDSKRRIYLMVKKSVTSDA